MPTWRRQAMAVIVEALGREDVSWIEWDAIPPTLPGDGSPVFSAVGHLAPSVERTRVLAELRARLPAEAVVVVVDHNRPRRFLAALAALAAVPWVPSWSPVARWRRLAHPTARELQQAGFRVERLRLVAAERVQVVVARRAPK